MFPEKWIGTNGAIRWPPRSCDLTPLDSWLWAYIKNIIYKVRSDNMEDLRERTRAAFQRITPVMIRNATNAVLKRCQVCITVEGRQFENLHRRRRQNLNI
ncbi:hypothetical protein NQ315_008891 [Exocentrus adspersus]|uniref:Transposase n=1 Tax=Exocentrus adspersus TaxID=1586481 RepID=A0AAV8V981_9CUCU|nr:hypothetical protein NQ315_008891 [Exocentrus adspersus]